MATADPNFKNRTTPGVYITELDAFPPSIAGVATAVPCFIGYTRTAVLKGKQVRLRPVPIASLIEYEQVFGKDFNPTYEITLLSSGTPPSTADLTVGGASYRVIQPSSQPRYNLYRSMRLFFENGGGTCFVVSVGDYTRPVSKDALLKGLSAIAGQTGPTMLVIPDAVNLPADPPSGSPVPTSQDFIAVTRAMLDQCATLQDRVAIFDLYGSTSVTQANLNQTLAPCVAQFQDSVISTQPSYGMAYFPFLRTSLVTASNVNYTNFTPALRKILTVFNQEQYPAPNSTHLAVQQYIGSLNQSAPHDDPAVTTLNAKLAAALPRYQQLLALVAAKEAVLPPSGAIAGVFTTADQNRGVWNAPANMGLNAVIAPDVLLNDKQQGGLNSPVNGKAIDVIRQLPNRGPVVWGARTLDGNSSDWRYVSVRRTVIYIEQSIGNVLRQFVFSPNTGETWATVTGMISTFLQGLWTQGGLTGSKSSEAFAVNCGIFTTMTAEDILNGYMIVQVILQLIHPGEFITLTFKQAMQNAA